MKKLIMFSLLAMFIASGFGQVKKDKLPKGKDSTSNIKRTGTAAPQYGKEDSAVVRFVRLTDTSKVRVTVYVDDYSLSWMKGYVLIHKLRYNNNQNDVQQEGKPEYCNEKFERIAEQDVLSIVKYDWK